MERSIFFFDFDETLYGHSIGRVPQSAQDAIGKLQARGHNVVIVTGRGPESVEFIQRHLNVRCETMILLNGQLVYSGGHKRFERFITLPSIYRIIEKAQAQRLAYGGYYANGGIVNQVNDRVATVWSDFQSPLPHVQDKFERNHALYQGHLYITREEAEIFDDCLEDYLINWSHKYLVNLISKQAGKSQGIRWVLEESGMAIEQSYAFGDGFNDVDMLQFVGCGIAMGNAAAEVKQAANYITDAVEADGIWRALAHYGFV